MESGFVNEVHVHLFQTSYSRTATHICPTAVAIEFFAHLLNS